MGCLIHGMETDAEEALQAFTGTPHCVMTTSGTVSLTPALLAAGVTAGDEVIVSDLTMIATANAAALIGAVPVFVDIEPATLNMDLSLAEAAMTPRTRAVVHVSLNGRSNDIHDSIGFNFKFTDFQAVIGLEQMKKLAWRLDRKKDIWRRYREHLSDMAAISWIDTDTDFVAPWFIDIFVEERDELARHLKKHEIGSRPIYPPLHSQKAYGRDDLSFPVIEHFAARGLWLPSSSKLQDTEIDRIAATIRSFFKG